MVIDVIDDSWVAGWYFGTLTQTSMLCRVWQQCWVQNNSKTWIYFSMCTQKVRACACTQHNRCHTWSEKIREEGAKKEFSSQSWIPRSTPGYLGPIRRGAFHSFVPSFSFSRLCFCSSYCRVYNLLAPPKATAALLAQARKIKGQNFENVPLSAPI